MGVVTMMLKQIAAAAGLSVLLAIPATAHHSQVMYDGDTEMEMKGVVEEFD